MNYLEFEEKEQYLYELIISGYKACPKEFANKLSVPLRTFYRILDIVKAKYGDVEYDRTTHKYHFLEGHLH